MRDARRRLDDADAPVAVQRALDEPAHAVDLARRVRRVAREDVAGDDAWPSITAWRCSTSSVASGRAKKRNGTKVVPSPGETCIVAAGAPVDARRVARAGARAAPSPPGYGIEIWPSCMWPARTRSKAPGGRQSSDVREVAEQDAQVGVGVRRARRASTSRSRYARGSTPTIWTRRPRSSTVAASSTSRRAGARSVEPARLRERVAAVLDVVVAEHDVAGGRAARAARAARLAPRARDEVAGDARRGRARARADPLDRALDRARPARRQAEVEVGEVRDAQARRARRGSPRQRRVERRAAAPSPPRTSPRRGRAHATARRRRGTAPEQRPSSRRRRAQTSSFSSTGVDRRRRAA